MTMLVLALLLLHPQDAAADAEAYKLLAGISGLLADPIKNADELDGRFEKLKKILEGAPEFKSREAVLSWMPRLGRKTGRAAEALPFARERLRGKIDPRQLDGTYADALYTAALALKPEEAVSIARELAKAAPGSVLAQSIPALEKDAAALGRAGASVSALPYDGSKFSWAGATRDKIVLLYFCASW